MASISRIEGGAGELSSASRIVDGWQGLRWIKPCPYKFPVGGVSRNKGKLAARGLALWAVGWHDKRDRVYSIRLLRRAGMVSTARRSLVDVFRAAFSTRPGVAAHGKV